MKEIREMYSRVMDKGEFQKNLAPKINVSASSISDYLTKKDGKFRDCHIEKVKQCLTIQLQIDKQVKDMNVKAWSLI